jgi:hypothetical protein
MRSRLCRWLGVGRTLNGRPTQGTLFYASNPVQGVPKLRQAVLVVLRCFSWVCLVLAPSLTATRGRTAGEEGPRCVGSCYTVSSVRVRLELRG